MANKNRTSYTGSHQFDKDSNEIKKEPTFITLKTFLKCMEFGSQSTPAIFFNSASNGEAVNQISIDVQSQVDEGLSIFLVQLNVVISPKLVSDGQEVFNLKLSYCSIIKIIDSGIGKEELYRLLTIDIPKELYGQVRALVWDITTASGFPGMVISDFDFAKYTSQPHCCDVDSDERLNGVQDGSSIRPCC